MSQQEDDLRALAKIMDFLRAVSIIWWLSTSIGIAMKRYNYGA